MEEIINDEHLENANLETPANADILYITNITEKVKNEMAKVIIGQETVIDLMLSALFIGGHIF